MKKLAFIATRCWTYFEFLRGNYRLVIFWPLAGLLVASAAWGFLLQRLDVERNVADRTALRVVAENASVQARRIGRNLAMIDQMLAVVKMQWQMLDGDVKLNRLKTLEPFPGSHFDLVILDKDGVVNMTTSGRAGIEQRYNFSQRPFFTAQKNAMSDSFVVGLPLLSASSGKVSLNYSRRLVASDGTFAGVVAINIDADSLITDYDEAVLGRRGLLEVIGDDNISRSARLANKNVEHAVTPDQVGNLALDSPGEKFLEGNFFADARNRYLAWSPVDGYPLSVLVGMDQQDYLGIYFERRNASINTAINATVALAVFVLIAIMLSIGLVRKNHQLQNAHTTYRIATEGGDDGFFILALRAGKARQVADFRVIDCNERGAEIFYASRQ